MEDVFVNAIEDDFKTIDELGERIDLYFAGRKITSPDTQTSAGIKESFNKSIQGGEFGTIYYMNIATHEANENRKRINIMKAKFDKNGNIIE